MRRRIQDRSRNVSLPRLSGRPLIGFGSGETENGILPTKGLRELFCRGGPARRGQEAASFPA